MLKLYTMADNSDVETFHKIIEDEFYKEKEPQLDDKILNLPPIRLEWLAESMGDLDYKSVYHLPLLLNFYIVITSARLNLDYYLIIYHSLKL